MSPGQTDQPAPALPTDNLADYLHVSWRPDPAEERVRATRRGFISSIVSLVIALGVWGGYYAWTRSQDMTWQGTGQWVVTGIVIGLSLTLIIARLIIWRRAVGHRRTVGEGEVITISWPGIQIAGQFWAWPEVQSITSRKGRRGSGEHDDAYVFVTAHGEQVFRVEDLDVAPATLEDAVWAYSQRRINADLSQIAH